MIHKDGSAKFFLVLTRVLLGALFFYAGYSKLINPSWSAEGYLRGAKTFSDFYIWLTSPSVLPITNFLNEWGLTLLGISLILGIGVRLSSILGALLMILYYFPILSFPYPNPHAYIVDEHIVYASILLYFAAVRAGRFFGLDAYVRKSWLG